jgi:hypothetical protein
MFYIDRNKLIAEILNEDLAFDGNENNPRKRAALTHNSNTEQQEGKKQSKGGQKRFKGDTATTNLIFRMPTKKELMAAEDACDMRISGDYQMGQLITVSKILFDFDILHKIYRSKKDNWNDQTHNASTVDKLLDGVRRQFSKKTYSPDTPIEQVAEDLQNSTDELEKEYGVRIPELIGAIPDWATALTIPPKTKSPDMPRGFNPIIMKNLITLKGDAEAKRLYPRINELLIDASTKYKNPKAYAKYVSRCQTIQSVLGEPMLKRLFDKAMTSPNVTDVEELVLFLNTNLTNMREEKRPGNSVAILHNNAMKAIQGADVMMKRKGFKEGVRNIHDMFEYLEEYRPDSFAHICRTYGLDSKSVHQFNSYKDFCDWLYSDPTRLGKIYLSARVEGKEGARMNVEYSELDKKERALRKVAANGGRKRGVKGASIEEKERKLADCLEAIEQLDREIASLPEGDPEIKEKQILRAKLRKKYTDGTWLLNKAKEKLAAQGDVPPPAKSLNDEIDELRRSKEAIRDQEYNRLKDDVDIEKFEDKYNKEVNRYSTGEYDMAEGYVTMAFTLDLTEEESEVVEWTENRIEKILNNMELKAGKEDLINVSSESGKYEGKMRKYPCTRFIIDYPQGSALYAKLKKLEKPARINYVAEFITKIIKAIDEQFGIAVNLVTSDRNHRVLMMSKEQSPNYKFSR